MAGNILMVILGKQRILSFKSYILFFTTTLDFHQATKYNKQYPAAAISVASYFGFLLVSWSMLVSSWLELVILGIGKKSILLFVHHLASQKLKISKHFRFSDSFEKKKKRSTCT